MSRENVKLVRALQPAPGVDIAALMRNDAVFAALAAGVAPVLSDEFEAVTVMPTGRERYRGIDGLRAAWLDWLEPWESYRTEIQDAVDAGERVLLLTRDYGRRHGSAAEVVLAGAAVWTLRDAKIVSAQFYADRAEALAAVGLSE
jgi:hypothetical protein